MNPDPLRSTRVDSRLKRAAEAGTLPRELVICGPAGTGKTFGILAFIHLIAADYPGLRILFFRKTRKALTESVCVTYEQEILPADGMESIAAGAQRRNRSSYRYPRGTEIVLAGLDEPTRIASTAWDIAFGNEAIECSEEGWDTVRSRLNRPGRDRRFGFLIGDTNPGDPSHWIKLRADVGALPFWDTGHRANPAMWDGRDWTPAGRHYLENSLSPLRGTRRKRLFEGLWAAGEGQWFATFDDGHVRDSAAYDPAFPVHLAVDSGVHSAVVWFQVRPGPVVTVFGDYYSFNVPAFDVATRILEKSRDLCRGRLDVITTDPAGVPTAVVGPTVVQEYRRAGLKADPWPVRGVPDGLALIDSFVAVDPPALLVHPACTRLLEAFANYKRAKRGGQWIDRPEDPQHPYEDVMDALRGGLQEKFPDGRKAAPAFRTVGARGGRLR